MAWRNRLSYLAEHLNRPNHRYIPTPPQVKDLEQLSKGFGLCPICCRWFAGITLHSKKCQKRAKLLEIDATRHSSAFLSLDIHRRLRSDDAESMTEMIAWADKITWDEIASYPFKTVLPNSVTSPSWKKVTANLNIMRDRGFPEQASKLFHVAVQMIFGDIARNVTADPGLDDPPGNTIIMSRMSRFLDGEFKELLDLSRNVPPPKKPIGSAAAKQKRTGAHRKNADYSKPTQILAVNDLLDPCDDRVWAALQAKCIPSHEPRKIPPAPLDLDDDSKYRWSIGEITSTASDDEKYQISTLLFVSNHMHSLRCRDHAEVTYEH